MTIFKQIDNCVENYYVSLADTMYNCRKFENIDVIEQCIDLGLDVKKELDDCYIDYLSIKECYSDELKGYFNETDVDMYFNHFENHELPDVDFLVELYC